MLRRPGSKDSVFQDQTGFVLRECLDALERWLNFIGLEPDELNLRPKADAIFNEITQTGIAPTAVIRDLRIIPKKRRLAMVPELVDGQATGRMVARVEEKENFVEKDKIEIKIYPPPRS